MRRIRYLVIHHNGVPGRTIEDVRRSHRAKGWRDVGYHYLVHEDGTLHRGRPESQVGAHVEGLNASSIGICLIGNGNDRDFTPQQYGTLEGLLLDLLARYPGAKILGHRETPPFVPKGMATSKQCPGTKINLDRIRAMVKRGPQAIPD
jgi:N-acetylmuramoyl-L-alanine amidase